MNNNVNRLIDMRKVINTSQKRRNDGIRLATDIRSFISKNVIQSLATPLGIVVVET